MFWEMGLPTGAPPRRASARVTEKAAALTQLWSLPALCLTAPPVAFLLEARPQPREAAPANYTKASHLRSATSSLEGLAHVSGGCMSENGPGFSDFLGSLFMSGIGECCTSAFLATVL